MRLVIHTVPLLALALIVAACESTPTVPTSGADDVGLVLTTSSTQDQRDAPLLHRLFGAAIRKVKAERGEEAANQLTAEYIRLHRAAREAHASGETERARELLRAAKGVAARVVTRVYGPAATERVLNIVDGRITTLSARIAAAEAQGTDAARTRAVAQRASRLAAAARAELRSGRVVAALVHAAEAADLLASMDRR